MMASDGEEEDEGGEKTTPYPRRRTTIELLSEENGWRTVLSKQHVQDGPVSQHTAGSSDTSSSTTQGVQLCKPIMASIEVKTKTCDGTQEQGGWLSPLSGPQRSCSLTDMDNFDLDGSIRTHNSSASDPADHDYSLNRLRLASSGMSHGETFAQALLCRPVMAPIKIKTKTFDGTQEERGWPSSRYDPQRQRSLTDPDNIDLDGGGRSHDQQYQRKRPSLSSSDLLRGEFTESSEPNKTRRRSYNDDLLLDCLNDNHGGGLNDDSNHSNSNTRRKSLPADFHTLETTESQPMLDYGKFFHDTSQSTDLTPSVFAPGQLHQGQEFQQHYNIIQNSIIQTQQQEIERLNSMVKTSTPPTTFSSSDDAPPYSDNFPSSSSSSSSLQQNNVEFVSTLRSMQETLCNLGSTVSTLQDDIAMERITKAFEIVESSARYILSGDSPMAYASLSEAWEIIEYLQTRLSGDGRVSNSKTTSTAFVTPTSTFIVSSSFTTIIIIPTTVIIVSTTINTVIVHSTIKLSIVIVSPN